MRRALSLLAPVLLAGACELIVTNDDLVIPAGLDAGSSPDVALPSPDAAALGQDVGLADASAAVDGGTDAAEPGSDAQAAGLDAQAAGPDAQAAGPDAGAAGPDAQAAGPDAATQFWCPFGGDAGGLPVADGSVLVDVTSDPLNCGGCGHACGTAYAVSVSCGSSKCEWNCPQGLAHCDTDAGDSEGCNTALNTISNCGACGVACGQRFVNSSACHAADAGGYACEIVCQTNHAHCSSDPGEACEVETDNDQANCGMCGYSCDQLQCGNNLCLVASSHTNAYGQIVMDATDVYWPNESDKIVYAASKTQPGVRAVSAPMSAALQRSIAVDGANVYVGSSEANLYSVFKGSTSGTLTKLYTGSGWMAPFNQIGLIAVDQGTLFFFVYQSTNNAGCSFPAAGSSTPAVQLTGDLTNFVASGQYVFRSTTSAAGVDVRFLDMNVSATNWVPIVGASGTAGYFGWGELATDGALVYWRTQDGYLKQGNRNSTGTAASHPFQRGSVGQGIVADAANVYFGAGGLIIKLPVAQFTQAAESVLLTPPGNLQQIIGVDATSLYFASATGGVVSIYRTRK
jgi:hypothetical protein